MKSSSVGFGILVYCALAVLSLAFLGCELESADSVVRTVGAGVSGTYIRDGGSNTVVSTNSGKPIFSFDLRQTGDQLEAIDNNNCVYRGTIGRESDTLLTYSLEGQNSRGTHVTMSGTIEITGGDDETSQGTMRGTWIEPGLYATIYGVASVHTGGGGGAGGPFTLAITIVDPGEGSVALNPAGGTYAAGTVVTLTASPAAGHTFNNWSGNLSGNNNPAQITMDANKSVTANFN